MIFIQRAQGTEYHESLDNNDSHEDHEDLESIAAHFAKTALRLS